MADHTPVYVGENFTMTASAAITGGQVLKVSGVSTVEPSTAITDELAGVAAHDAASGTRVTVWHLQGNVHELVASAAVTAGQVVEPSTTAGQVKLRTTGTRVGVALTTAAAGGAKLRVLGGA
ncbi:capsid cement protein [Micromonospora sp. IBHARD004]|uniref:capsid cement protein n=1 Tax=Micromonospora sp. IBHARD004 TaxID=3457764 RepID=UPI0040580A64